METSNFGTNPARPPTETLASQEISKAQEVPQAPDPDPRITVVICDDHPAYAQGLALLLLLEHEAAGFKVVGVATKATDAVPMAQALNPQVVLMDIRMPAIDGIEATRQIKAASKDTKVVMLTVSDEPGDLYEAMRAGASGFVTKDKEVAEIAQAIQQVLNGHLVIPADLSTRFLTDVTNADITHSLTEIETVLLTGFTQGKTNKQIAQTLEVSERTVCRRIDDLYRKLNLSDRIQAAIWASQQGFGTPNRNGAKRPVRPLKVRSYNRKQKSLVQTPTHAPTQEESTS